MASPIRSIPREAVSIICGAEISSFIDQIRLSSQFSEDSKIIIAKGYIPRWSEAIGGIGKIVDEAGKIQQIKIFAVPFANQASGINTSIIGALIQAEDGSPIYKFITEATIPAISGASIIPAADISIKPVTQAIEIGNRTEIWNAIIRLIDMKPSIPGIEIKRAFENSGYACASAPTWFPRAGLWYAASCIRAER